MPGLHQIGRNPSAIEDLKFEAEASAAEDKHKAVGWFPVAAIHPQVMNPLAHSWTLRRGDPSSRAWHYDLC
jgi:hypothetical protein